MKAFLYKAKGALALALAMSLFCPQVFAAESLSAAEQGVQEFPDVAVTANQIKSEAKPVMTIEKALDRAIKYSADIKNLEDELDQTREDYEDMSAPKMPTYDYRKWVNDGVYRDVTAVFMAEQSISTLKTSRVVTEIGLEAGVKGSFIAIRLLEESLVLVEEAAEMQETAYKQGQVKHRLGMLSTYNLNQLKVAADQAAADVASLKAQLEQQYISFNKTIGENPETRFDFVYDVTLQPLELIHDLDLHIRNAMKKDPMIEMQEIATEITKFTSNYRPYSDTEASQNSSKLSYDKQQRALKTAKENTELAMRKAYLEIKQLETDYEIAKANLTKAQADYRVAQLSYQVGAVTKTAVEGAEMAMKQSENALTQLVYEHDLKVFMFENPFLLTLSSSAQ